MEVLFKRPQSLLMVRPDHFNIAKAINPHMLAGGQLNSVDQTLAHRQWSELKVTYEKLGRTVHVISGHEGLPDMTFAANQSFPFWPSDGSQPQVILSNMKYTIRQPEVAHFAHWYKEKGYELLPVDERYKIEGQGDLIWHPNGKLVFAGYGFRTDQKAIEFIKKEYNLPVLPIALQLEVFYHLDTCLAPLDNHHALVVPEAFTAQGLDALKQHFRHLLKIPFTEAAKGFAGNAHCPDGKHVILQKNNPLTEQTLKDYGFTPLPVDTSEFIKSGGSVFCLKMEVF